MIVTTYHYFERTWSIIRVVSLDSHDIRPWDFNLILKTTIKDFPHQLMLCKVTLCHQVSFISRLILQKITICTSITISHHICLYCIECYSSKLRAYLPIPNVQNGSRKIGGLQFRISSSSSSSSRRRRRSLLIFLFGFLLLGEPHLNQIQKGRTLPETQTQRAWLIQGVIRSWWD